MATNFTVSVDEVTCPVCCDVFTNPVVLPCSHSLCKACLQQCWRSGDQKCPICRRVAPCGADPPVNLVLKNLCERFCLEQEASGGSETLCSRHREKLLLFCLVDKQPICAECVVDLHNNHKVCHIKVAVRDHQAKLKMALKPLQEKLKALHDIKVTGDQTMQYIKHQAQHTERQIKEEFKQLHQFLHREEEASINALKQEEKQKTMTLHRKMEETSKKIAALSATITAIEKDMGSEDVLFLQKYDGTMKRTQCIVQEPDTSGLLIDEAKHLGNQRYRVWEKMLQMVQYSPVILDPNTAHPSLRLSADLTSVWKGKDKQLPPDNPERFSGMICILGSKGFSSGKHQWDVEVGRLVYGYVGVAKMSVGRKNPYSYPFPPSETFCCEDLAGGCREIGEIRGGNYNLRVQVDCDHRTVSIFDLYGNKFLRTYTYTFTGMVFPCFGFVYDKSLSDIPDKFKIIPATVGTGIKQ